MANPKDLEEGINKYAEFAQFQPTKVSSFAFSIPSKLYCVGKADWTFYESKKWEHKINWYKHEHEAGVGVYMPELEGDQPGKLVTTPAWLKSTKTLVKLGNSLGFEFQDLHGETLEANTTKPYPELYCIPSGKALLVIQNKKTLIACFWGGYLSVTARGIVG